MSKLLPCPFCGAGARLENRGRGYAVMCDQRHTDCQMNMRTHHHDVADDAVAAWNYRTPPHNNQEEADRA